MKRLVISMLATAIGFAGTAVQANASGDTPHATRTAFIEEYDNTLAPLQFVKFCMNYPTECNFDAAEQLLPSSGRAMAMLQEVNASVNEEISPMHKPTDPMNAHWALSPSAGDCNDYAVTKRHKLIAMGFPKNALRLAVVLVNGGAGHLVLVARLAEGDVVLDNLSHNVRPWNATAYEWISMQSSSDPRFWVAVDRHGLRLHEIRLASSARSPL